MIEIGPLRPGDRAAWEKLARGYKAFYSESEPDEAYERTWQRLAAGTELSGLGARLDGRLVGIAHYFFHPAFWSGGGGRGGQGARGGPVLLAHPGGQHQGPRALRQGGALHRVHSLLVSSVAPSASPDRRSAAARTPSMNSPMPNR